MDGELHTGDLPYDVVCSSQDRAHWLRARLSGIGASEVAAVVEEHSRLSLAKLVAIKRGLLVDDETREWLEWGLRLEDVIADAYSSSRYAGRPTRRAGNLLRSKAHPWALATLDREVWIAELGRWVPLEIKTQDVNRDAWAEGPPSDYDWQLHGQMLVTESPVASIACLLGPHKLVWCDVERDETKIRRLIVAGRSAWSLIRSDREPPAPYERETFDAFWPKDNGSVVALDEEFSALDIEREELLATKKATVDRLDAIDMQIRLAMKDATTGVLVNGRTSFSLKTQRRNGTEFRVLRRHEKKERS